MSGLVLDIGMGLILIGLVGSRRLMSSYRFRMRLGRMWRGVAWGCLDCGIAAVMAA
jgi:hypothetical protein